MRFLSAKLTIAIVVILLTAIACSIGIRAELHDSAAAAGSRDRLPSPDMPVNAASVD